MSNDRKLPKYPNKYATAHSIADGKYYILEDAYAETKFGRQIWMSVQRLNKGPDLFIWIPRGCDVPEESQIGGHAFGCIYFTRRTVVCEKC
jgi:hypothetical protein